MRLGRACGTPKVVPLQLHGMAQRKNALHSNKGSAAAAKAAAAPCRTLST